MLTNNIVPNPTQALLDYSVKIIVVVCLLDKTPVAHFALELALDCIDKRTG